VLRFPLPIVILTTAAYSSYRPTLYGVDTNSAVK
jgi:hypothetical protein